MLVSFFPQVTHLLIKRPPLFNYRPGDYLYLNIPTIARYEWHPFTISSAPEQKGTPSPPSVQIFTEFHCAPSTAWKPVTQRGTKPGAQSSSPKAPSETKRQMGRHGEWPGQSCTSYCEAHRGGPDMMGQVVKPSQACGNSAEL